MSCGTYRCVSRVVLAALVLAGVAWASYQLGLSHSEEEHHAELNHITLRELVWATDAIRTRLGRAPHDQEELERLLGRPLPFVYDDSWGGMKAPVHYRRTGDNSFQVHYELMATDDWTYDSTKPAAGWVQSYY